MQLRDSRLVDAQLGADFLHRDFFVVVEADDATLAGWQHFDRGAHAIANLATLVGVIGTLRLGGHEDGWQLRLVNVVAAGERGGGLDGVDANDGLAQTLFVGTDRGGKVGE